jgi:hypothetical protein
MRVADRIVLDRAQAKPLAGVVGRLLQPAIVKPSASVWPYSRKQLAVVGPSAPRDLAPDGIAVEIGAVEKGGVRDWSSNQSVVGGAHPR